MPGAPQPGVLESAGDVDWFRMELAGGTSYQIDLLGDDNQNMTGWWVDSIQKGMIQQWDGTPVKQALIIKANQLHELQAKHSIPDIYRELGEILCNRYPGWEINDGGSGAFIFGLHGRRMHEHSENIMTTNESEGSF